MTRKQAQKKSEPKLVGNFWAKTGVTIIYLSIIILVRYVVGLVFNLLPDFTYKGVFYTLGVLALAIYPLYRVSIISWVKFDAYHAMVLYDDFFNTIRVVYAGMHPKLPWENALTEEGSETKDGTIDLRRDKLLTNLPGEKYQTKNGRWVELEWYMHITPHKYYLPAFIQHNLDGVLPVFRARIKSFLWDYTLRYNYDDLMGEAVKANALSQFQRAFGELFNGHDIENPACTDPEEKHYGVWTGTPMLSAVIVSEDAQEADELRSEGEKVREEVEKYVQLGINPTAALAAQTAQLTNSARHIHLSVSGLENAKNVSIMAPGLGGEQGKGKNKDGNQKKKGK